MDAILIHNPTAGAGDVSAERTLDWLRAAGYNPLYQSTKEPEFPSALKRSAKLIVAAGGDGTITKVAMHCSEIDAPIAILPLGTANNIATALGISGTPEEIIATWANATQKNFSLWKAIGPWGEKIFLEGCGVGLLAKVAADMSHSHDTDKYRPRQKLAAVRSVLRKTALTSQPVKLRAKLDEGNLEGEFLFLEILNIGRAGPRLALAPKIDPTDGYLDVAYIEAENRQVFIDWLDAGNNTITPTPATVRRCQTVHLTWQDAEIRVGDELWPQEGNCITQCQWQTKIQLAPQRLSILTPG